MTIMQGNTNHVLRIEALYVSECMRREALAWEFKIAEAYRAFIYIPYEKKTKHQPPILVPACDALFVVLFSCGVCVGEDNGNTSGHEV